MRRIFIFLTLIITLFAFVSCDNKSENSDMDTSSDFESSVTQIDSESSQNEEYQENYIPDYVPENKDPEQEEAKDIVFMGDSITHESNFAEAFSNGNIKKVAVVGYSITDMTRDLVPQLKNLKPIKVFVMGGINGLKPDNIESSLEKYKELTLKIKETCPRAAVYVQSVLPIAAENEKDCPNWAIDEFNDGLKKLSDEEGYHYIDINSLLKDENGVLADEYSRDGVHLNPAAYDVWKEILKEYI